MSDEAVEMKLDGLEKLLKAMKGRQVTARVGILGSKDARSSDGGGSSSNATIGAAHEFGSVNLPQRSFLRVPIADNLEKYLEKSGAFDKDALAQTIKDASFLIWMKKVAAVAEAIVLEAFDSKGFGKWPSLSPKTMARKKTQQVLVETQQLRNSITSEVK